MPARSTFAAPMPAAATPMVLVIDDDPGSAALLAALVAEAGGCAVPAANGRDGLHLLRRMGFGLIVTDIYMPGEDGFGVMRARWESGRQVPLIAVSGGVSAAGFDVHRSARLLGADASFAKPLSPVPFIACVRRLLGGTAPVLQAAA